MAYSVQKSLGVLEALPPQAVTGFSAHTLAWPESSQLLQNSVS